MYNIKLNFIGWTIHTNLQRGLVKIQKFFNDWKIKINSEKTQSIFFTTKRKAVNLPSSRISLKGNTVEWSNVVKYLGVMFDKRLTFRSHIEYSCSRALKFIRILYPLICRNSHLCRSNKLLLYKSIFRSILSYAVAVWIGCAKTHFAKLQRVQNKCLKIIHNLPFFYNTEKLHKLAGVPFLKEFCEKLNEGFERSCRLSDNNYIRNLE
jgi:hypothetical protein